MNLRLWTARLFKQGLGIAKKSPFRRPNGSRLAVEMLEERLAPAWLELVSSTFSGSVVGSDTGVIGSSNGDPNTPFSESVEQSFANSGNDLAGWEGDPSPFHYEITEDSRFWNSLDGEYTEFEDGARYDLYGTAFASINPINSTSLLSRDGNITSHVDGEATLDMIPNPYPDFFPAEANEHLGDPVTVHIFVPGGVTTAGAGTVVISYHVIPDPAYGGEAHNESFEYSGDETHQVHIQVQATLGDDIRVTYTLHAAAITDDGSGASARADLGALWVYTRPLLPDVAVTQADWDKSRDLPNKSAERGVNVTYTVLGADLPADTKIAYYWANGANFSNRIGGPISNENLGSASLYTVGTHHLNNDALKWGTPPPNATYILAVIAPPSYFSGNMPPQFVSAVRLHSQQEIMYDAQTNKSALTVEHGDNEFQIYGYFRPGAGKFTMSEAEVAFGVDHFNWIQHVEYPNYMKIYEDYDIDGTANPIVSNGYLDPNIKVGDLDELWMYSSFAIGTDGTRTPNQDPRKFVRFGPGRPDSLEFYINEDDEEVADRTSISELVFYDSPVIPMDFFDPNRNDYVHFTTQLVGVSSTGRSIPLPTNTGKFEWKSNAAWDRTDGNNVSGGVVFFGGAGAPMPTVGGIFDIETDLPEVDSPLAGDDLAFGAIGNSLTIDVLANDQAPADSGIFISFISTPAHGTASLDDNGTPDDFSDDRIIYQRDVGYTGDDEFDYTIFRNDHLAFANAHVSVVVDDTAPAITVSGPSALAGTEGSVVYTVTYADAYFLSSNLSAANVHLVTTGTASGDLTFDNSTGLVRTVTISNTDGNGMVGITIDAGSGIDRAGNQAPAAGPSVQFLQVALPTIDEDLAAPAGALISGLLANHFSDTDGNGKPGIAVTQLAGNGTWQYLLGGTAWKPFGAVSDEQAMLLTSTNRIRFVPAKNWNGQARLLFHAWDGSLGKAGERWPIVGTGGSLAFSTAIGLATAQVEPRNDAPTRTAATFNVTIPNDPAAIEAGKTIAALAAGAFSDADGDAFAGVAVVGVAGTGGAWQFSHNGGPWTDFDTVKPATARVLDADDVVRFFPTANFIGKPTIQLRAWDGTSDAAGIVNLSLAGKTGGGSAFSANLLTAGILVNNAPTLGGAVGPAVSTKEDTTSAAMTVASLLSSALVADNSGALKGVAIVGATGPGTWQYSLNGTAWFPVGAVTEALARLLPSTSTAKIRFVPAANQTGAGTLVYRAWDQTAGIAGALSPITSTGGFSAFSANEAISNLTVVGVNDAPTWSRVALYNSGATDTAGRTIAAIAATSFIDLETPSVTGVAVVGSTGTGGTWQFSRNNGGDWTDFGTVSPTKARLLAAADLVRFVPPASFTGNAALILRAWDGTTGVAGNPANASTTGGSSAYSTTVLTVTAVNAAPTLGKTTGPALATKEDTTSAALTVANLLTAAVAADTNAAARKGVAIVGATGPVTWQFTLDGRTWFNMGTVTLTSARLLPSTPPTKVRFVPSLNQSGTGTLIYRAWDQTAGTPGALGTITSTGSATAFSSSTATTSLTVNPVNDRPVVNPAIKPLLPPLFPGTVNLQGSALGSIVAGAINDVDNGALQGVAITALTGLATGVWEYSVDNGASWKTVGAVSAASALLLRITDLIRYSPSTASFKGAATFTFKAWDRTTGGNPGAKASTASSAFSLATGIATALFNTAPDLIA